MDNELLQVDVPTELVVTETIHEVLIEQSTEILISGSSSEYLYTEPSIEILEIAVQGPPGPPGSGGSGGSFEAVSDTDYSISPLAYIGYPSVIIRVDYSVSPPNRKDYPVTNYVTDWNNRYNLGYL